MSALEPGGSIKESIEHEEAQVVRFWESLPPQMRDMLINRQRQVVDFNPTPTRDPRTPLQPARLFEHAGPSSNNPFGDPVLTLPRNTNQPDSQPPEIPPTTVTRNPLRPAPAVPTSQTLVDAPPPSQPSTTNPQPSQPPQLTSVANSQPRPSPAPRPAQFIPPLQQATAVTSSAPYPPQPPYAPVYFPPSYMGNPSYVAPPGFSYPPQLPMTQQPPLLDPTQAVSRSFLPGPASASCSSKNPPNFSQMEKFANLPHDSWDNFIERWELLIKPYKLSNEELAHYMPNMFTGAAFAKYKTVVREQPHAANNYSLLRPALDKIFRAHVNLQGRGLYTMSQGKRSVGVYYADLSAVADTAYSDIPDKYRDSFLADIFIQGLNAPIRNALSSKGKLSLLQAVNEAEMYELNELNQCKSGKVNQVDVQKSEIGPLIEPLAKQIKDLRKLFETQANKSGNAEYKPRQQQPGTFYNNTQQQFAPRNPQGHSGRPRFQNPQGHSGRPPYQQQQGFPGGSRPYRPTQNRGQAPRTCYICHSPGHFAKACPQRKSSVSHIQGMPNENAEVDTGQYTPEQYAALYLTQEYADNPVNSVSTQDPGKSRGKSRKLRASDALTLMMIASLCLCSGSEALEHNVNKAIPGRPMVCGSVPSDGPKIYNLTHDVQCSARKNSSNQPQDVKIEIYKQNLIQWKSKAYQCTKFTSTISTQITFFRDIKTKHTSSTIDTVTREECESMVNLRQCSDGPLTGGGGVFITHNPINAEYVYCCKEHHFSAKQCSVIEANVYKRHGQTEFESTAGSVSHCDYNAGSCLLNDRSMLIWNKSPESYCQFEPWFNTSGKLLDNTFVSDDRTLAFTFNKHQIDSTNDCHKRTTSFSDQGLMVRFLTPINITTHKQHAIEKYQIQGSDGPVSIINALVQAMVVDVHTAMQDYFWNAYLYTCNNIRQTLKLVTMLMEEHPTRSARYLLQNPYIRAKSGPGIFEVYPCTPLDSSLYKLVPMKENNCTNFIPINVTMAGVNHTGYLDPMSNVIHKEIYTVNCNTREEVIVKLDDKYMIYHWKGTVRPLEHVMNISLPDLELGAHPIKLHETVFSQTHLMNWQDLSNHESLNDILSTLDRQKQVLEAAGVVSSRHNTLNENTVETQESLLGNSLFSFLFGGHVASGYELWTFTCNIILTVVTIAFILRKLRNRLCPNIKINMPSFGSSKLVANVQTEPENVDTSDSEESDNEATEVTNLNPVDTQLHVENEVPTNSNCLALTAPHSNYAPPTQPSAPTETSSVEPYRPIYPSLATATEYGPAIPNVKYEISWPSYYRSSQ